MILSLQDPRNIELMWDQMFKSTLNYGRKGLPMSVKCKSPHVLDKLPLLLLCGQTVTLPLPDGEVVGNLASCFLLPQSSHQRSRPGSVGPAGKTQEGAGVRTAWREDKG